MKIRLAMLIMALGPLGASAGTPPTPSSPTASSPSKVEDLPEIGQVAKAELVSIHVQVRMPDGTYKSLLLEGESLNKYNSIFWNDGADQILFPFYRQVRGESWKIDKINQLRAIGSAVSQVGPAIILKTPICIPEGFP